MSFLESQISIVDLILPITRCRHKIAIYIYIYIYIYIFVAATYIYYIYIYLYTITRCRHQILKNQTVPYDSAVPTMNTVILCRHKTFQSQLYNCRADFAGRISQKSALQSLCTVNWARWIWRNTSLTAIFFFCVAMQTVYAYSAIEWRAERPVVVLLYFKFE